MATFQTVILAVLSATLAQGQRPSFAGSRPIGFPELPEKSTTTVDPLGNRFGETGTTERLPIEANGDRDLIDRISKFPIDKQPFWYLNWKALEEHRKNPQTYPQRPSQFAENPNMNSGDPGTLNSNAGINANPVPSSSATVNSRISTPNVTLGNRNGGSVDLNAKDGHNSNSQKQNFSTGFRNNHSYGTGRQ